MIFGNKYKNILNYENNRKNVVLVYKDIILYTQKNFRPRYVFIFANKLIIINEASI